MNDKKEWPWTKGKQPKKEMRTETFGPKTYGAKAVSLLDIVDCDVNIEIWDGLEIEVTITGPENVIDNTDVSQQGNIVCVSSKNFERKNSIFVNSNRNSVVINGFSFSNLMSKSYNGIKNCVINSNGLSIVCDNNKNPGKITIKVPKTTEVLIKNVEGHCLVGDTEGKIDVSIQGPDRVKIGKVTEAKLLIDGSGNISVNKIDGNAELVLKGSGEIDIKKIEAKKISINLVGSGDITIDSGNVSILDANLTGSGDIDFGGTATEALLNLVGSGDINVNSVLKSLTERIVGSGDITVNGRPIN